MLTKTLFAAKWMTTLHKRFSKDADQHVVEFVLRTPEPAKRRRVSDAPPKASLTNDDFWPGTQDDSLTSPAAQPRTPPTANGHC
jgi:hypothetical protein